MHFTQNLQLRWATKSFQNLRAGTFDGVKQSFKKGFRVQGSGFRVQGFNV